jgi:thiol-disulfide isomerase/thioredoxin
MSIKYSSGNAINTGIFIIAAVGAARYFFIWPMAKLLLAGAILHFAAGLFFERAASQSVLKKTVFLAGPFFLAGAILVFMTMANIFYLLPFAAPVSAFCGFFIRDKWPSGGFVKVFPIAIAWAALTGYGYYLILPSTLSHEFTADLNEPAPVFQVQNLAGEPISSQDFRGKVTLIDFWGTWCGPCVRQFPELQKVYDQYKDHPDVRFLMLNTGWSGDDVEKIQRFLQKYPYTFPVAYDGNGSMTKDFGITSLPHTLLMDKQGMIRMRHTGLLQQKGAFAAGLSERIEVLLVETIQ